MIRIRLFGKDHDNQYVDFLRIPVASEDDFRSHPEGLLSLAEAIQTANELGSGAVSGWLDPYRWYRQAHGSDQCPRIAAMRSSEQESLRR